MKPTDLIKYLDEIPEDYEEFFKVIPYLYPKQKKINLISM